MPASRSMSDGRSNSVSLDRESQHYGHGHRHGPARESRRRLTIVLVLTALYMFAEAFGGWWTRSLALLADSGHMLADVAALGLALMAVWFSTRPATPDKTFGYYRLEILAAFINGVGLILIAFFIFRSEERRVGKECRSRWSPYH